ncbi:hypothetical protein AWENTII_005463 [Aspergillus wentii]
MVIIIIYCIFFLSFKLSDCLSVFPRPKGRWFGWMVGAPRIFRTLTYRQGGLVVAGPISAAAERVMCRIVPAVLFRTAAVVDPSMYQISFWVPRAASKNR